MTLEAMLQEIRALPVEQRKQLIKLIVDTLPESPQEAAPRKRRNITEFRGVGAEMWEGIDAQEYVNRLRDEWS